MPNSNSTSSPLRLLRRILAGPTPEPAPPEPSTEPDSERPLAQRRVTPRSFTLEAEDVMIDILTLEERRGVGYEVVVVQVDTTEDLDLTPAQRSAELLVLVGTDVASSVSLALQWRDEGLHNVWVLEGGAAAWADRGA